MKTIVTQLNMVTIMEGVEEQSQLDILKRLGFTYIQGYYYSKPLPKEEIVEYLS
jgi:EAL domain-containing protein (putative c-di-GMP-specific phosphodiesterase class I)